jgi:hypothetical protein
LSVDNVQQTMSVVDNVQQTLGSIGVQSYTAVLAEIRAYATKLEGTGEAPQLAHVRKLARRALNARIGEAGTPREPAAAPPGSKAKTRAEWSNVLGNVVVRPREIFPSEHVTTLGSLVEVHERALANSTQVKAVGSGTSNSTVTSTVGYLVRTGGLDQVANLNDPFQGQLRGNSLRRGSLPLVLQDELPPWDELDYRPTEHRCLIEAQGGITVQRLAEALERMDLALPTMGETASQTIAGLCSTCAHGSGVTLGPICDSIRSLVIVTTGHWAHRAGSRAKVVPALSPLSADVMVYRVEPFHGISDPGKFADEHVTLIQSDGLFKAVTTSFGAMGVIYSVTLEAMQFYYLRTTATKLTWTQALAELRADPPTAGNPLGVPAVLSNARGVTYYWSPYPTQPYISTSTEHSAVRLSTELVSRDEAAYGSSARVPLSQGEAMLGAVFDAAVGKGLYGREHELDLAVRTMADITSNAPYLVPLLVNSSIDYQAAAGNRSGKWYDVCVHSILAYSGCGSEYAFPMQHNRTMDKRNGSFAIWPRRSKEATIFTTEHLNRGLQTFSVLTAQLRKVSQPSPSPSS